MNKGDNGIFLITGRGKNFIGQIFVGETKWTAQAVPDQVLGEATGKIVFFPSDQITHFKIVRKLRPFMEFTGRIDIVVPLCCFFTLFDNMGILCPPLAGGGEVFQPEPDRINLTVTTGTLRFFLVSENPFPGCEGLIGQAGKLGNIGRGRWWRIIQKIT